MATMGPMRPVDMELKKAFGELQSKLIATTQQLKMADLQIEQQKRQITHANLVAAELGKIPDTVNVYEGVGRMFIRQPMDKIKSNLKTKKSGAEDKIKTIETSKGYLERNLKESEDNLRELITSKQQTK